MRIGAKIQFFNYNMRSARARLGWTQKDLSEMSGVGINEIGLIERLCNLPGSRIGSINEKLCRIAATLEEDFDTLFPEEYLQMLQEKALPRRKTSFMWVKEVSLEQLYEDGHDIDEFLLSDPTEDEYITSEQADALREMLRTLSTREQTVLNARFGLITSETQTLETVADRLGVTRERVKQIETRALRKLRHPSRSRKLR